MRRVVVSQRVIENETYRERRDALSHEWIHYLQALWPGTIVLPLPNHLTDVAAWLDALDCAALVLSNGNDWGAAPERDRTEEEAFRYFHAKRGPVLGVCRGMQVINVLMQGTIVEDIAERAGGRHVACEHDVVLEPGPFSSIADGGGLRVNSFHDQGVVREGLGVGLEAFAVADGGLVEGLHHRTDPILGIQWHPERDNPAARFDADLLRTFFEHGAFWAGRPGS